jgi:ketosteroid isomerase-like protein
MKRLFFAAAMLVAASAPALGHTTTPRPSQGGDVQAVAARVREFRDALRKGDEAALASIYADDYAITNDTGEVQTKAERLAWVKANSARLSGLDFQDLKVRVYGDTAVVTGRATSTTDALNSRIIQVWVRQGGVWRLVAGQTTAIGPAQPAEKKP